MPFRRSISMLLMSLVLGATFAVASPVFAQNASSIPDMLIDQPLDRSVQQEVEDLSDFVKAGPEHWTSPQGLSSTIQILVLLTVISLAPALLIMTTSFIRITIVLGLLRQAIGTQQLPPGQVITALAMFMTFMVMHPYWQEVYTESIGPYTRQETNPETGEPFKLFAEKDPVTGVPGPDEAWRSSATRSSPWSAPRGRPRCRGGR